MTAVYPDAGPATRSDGNDRTFIREIETGGINQFGGMSD